MLFYSISVSAAQHWAVSFAIAALTAQAEIRTTVNRRSDWCCLFEESIKYDNTLCITFSSIRLYVHQQKLTVPCIQLKTGF